MAKAEFKIHQVPPGGRHDNDFADICSIKIMPTFDEIMSDQTEYLPLNDPKQLHLPGLPGLIDRQFRLLREDNVGPLRDAIRAELDRLSTPDKARAIGRGKQTQQQTHSYGNVKVVNLAFEKRLGFRFSVQFDKPSQVLKMNRTQQGEWWEQSRRLQTESPVCLLDRHGSLVFGVVSVPDPDFSGIGKEDRSQVPRPNKEPQRTVFEKNTKANQACVTLALVTLDATSIKSIVEKFVARGADLTLVEFPGVLIPSFQPTLLALQRIQTTGDLPFSDLLAPPANNNRELIDVPPPAYSLEPGFRFKLDCLMNNGEKLSLDTQQAFDIKRLQDRSPLDDMQSTALVDSLSRAVALIQGPPGTGKSYTGVSIIKVLLANKPATPIQHEGIWGDGSDAPPDRDNLGPILCVCFTNHALDQLLEHLAKSGVGNIIRIGSRSKSEVLAECTLHKVASRMPKTKGEGFDMFNLWRRLETLEENIRGILTQIKLADSEARIRDHLQMNHRQYYAEIFVPVPTDDEDFTRVHRKKSLLNRWLDEGHDHGLPLEQLVPESTATNLPATPTSRTERRRLHRFWVSEITEKLLEELNSSLLEAQDAKDTLDKIRREVDLRCLNQANVIGATTSGLARNIDLLRRVDARVMVCEEAGEVLESHTIIAFLPSIEHVILIGDHLQLRPQIKNYNLQHDSPGGHKYSLDISLFERLVRPPQQASVRLPFTTLETQRRMHPSISRLIRETLYPKLQDSAEMSHYPSVCGLRKRLFWFDHERAEDGASEVVATSKTNEFEVEMTAALVTHLIRQGVYRSENIAVLTPYLGQLRCLKQRFSSSFEIVVNDRDEEDLQTAELVADKTTKGQPTKAERTPVAKTALRDALRLATVDNFQGEEAAVVIISLVRCNSQNNCGFLRTRNRINVLLSRAKHGMYIIGNARTASNVQMWSDVIRILKESGNFGTSFELECSRHPTTPIAVSTPDDFTYFSPEGGCSLRCDKRLDCGHACLSKCHSDTLHAATRCLEPCPRPIEGCDHACPKVCGDPCVRKCTVPIHDPDRVLICGHSKTVVPCWQSQDLATVVCKELVTKIVPTCGHQVKTQCATNVAAATYKCTVHCEAVLPCGHTCKNTCEQFRILESNGVCSRPCGRKYTTCSHSCKKKCHGNEPCPPCEQSCEVSCSHSRCHKKCSEACAPCAQEQCASSCPHSQCTVPCAAPCNHLPCSKRCEKVLPCGHQCTPSFLYLSSLLCGSPSNFFQVHPSAERYVPTHAIAKFALKRRLRIFQSTSLKA
jgi:hypothetical protein